MSNKTYENDRNLREKTITALLFSSSGLLVNGFFQFILGIILARLLLPSDYGLFGMIMILIMISQTFIDGGLSTALIRESEVNQKDYSTVFFYNLIISVILYIFFYITAYSISTYFQEPILVPIIKVISLSLIFGSFGLIQKVMLIRKLDFKTQMFITLIASLLSGTVAIILAYKKFGVWALVYQTLIQQIVTSCLFMIHNRWKPLWSFSKDSFIRLFGFGWKMLITGILANLYQNIYNIIIGKTYSSVLLGYYTKSKQFNSLIALSVASSVSKVTFPVLSKLQNDDRALREDFIKIIKNTCFISFPIMIGLASISNNLVRVLFGNNWIPMIPYFQILCISEITLSHRMLNLNILQVKGRSDLFLKLDIIKITTGLLSVAFVAIFNLGIFSLMISLFLNSQLAFIINSFYSKKFIKYSTFDQIKDMLPSLGVSITMGVIIIIIGLVFPFCMLLTLIFQILSGVVIYIFISKLFRIEELNTIHGLFLKILRKQKPLSTV